MIAITVIMTMKLMMIMTLMANTLPVVAHQLVSQSVLLGLKKRVGRQM